MINYGLTVRLRATETVSFISFRSKSNLKTRRSKSSACIIINHGRSITQTLHPTLQHHVRRAVRPTRWHTEIPCGAALLAPPKHVLGGAGPNCHIGGGCKDGEHGCRLVKSTPNGTSREGQRLMENRERMQIDTEMERQYTGLQGEGIRQEKGKDEEKCRKTKREALVK